MNETKGQRLADINKTRKKKRGPIINIIIIMINNINICCFYRRKASIYKLLPHIHI